MIRKILSFCLVTSALSLVACGSQPRETFRQTITESGTHTSGATELGNGTGTDIGNEQTPETADSLEANKSATGASLHVMIGSGMIIVGNPEAKGTMRVYIDEDCAYCRQFILTELPSLERTLLMDGSLKIEWVFVPMTDAGTQMAKIAICAAEQGKFQEVDHVLASLPQAQATNTSVIAKKTGIKAAWLTECAASKKTEALLALHAENARIAGIERVPSFVIGKTKWEGLKPHEEFLQTLEQALPR